MKKTIPTLTAVIFILLTLTQCKNDRIRSGRCDLVPDAGPCKAMIPKYFYDTKEKKCKEFVWGGCDGTVPFDTMEECEELCNCK